MKYYPTSGFSHIRGLFFIIAFLLMIAGYKITDKITSFDSYKNILSKESEPLLVYIIGCIFICSLFLVLMRHFYQSNWIMIEGDTIIINSTNISLRPLQRKVKITSIESIDFKDKILTLYMKHGSKVIVSCNQKKEVANFISYFQKNYNP